MFPNMEIFLDIVESLPLIFLSFLLVKPER